MSIIKNLSGISTIYTNNIYSSGFVDSSNDISGNSIVGIPSLYFNGLTSNIQQQLNLLQSNLGSIDTIYTTKTYVDTEDQLIYGIINSNLYTSEQTDARYYLKSYINSNYFTQ